MRGGRSRTDEISASAEPKGLDPKVQRYSTDLEAIKHVAYAGTLYLNTTRTLIRSIKNVRRYNHSSRLMSVGHGRLHYKDEIYGAPYFAKSERILPAQ